MITMTTTKDDEQKAQVNQRTSQENQDQDQDSRIKNSRLKKKAYNQDSRSQESRSRFKTQDSRMKKRLNQDKY